MVSGRKATQKGRGPRSAENPSMTMSGVRVDRRIYLKFKAQCILEDKGMGDVMEDLMKLYVSKKGKIGK